MATLHVTRTGRAPTSAIELVHSPDDGGWYLSNTDFQNKRNRTSVKIYPSDTAAIADWQAGTVQWEDWY